MIDLDICMYDVQLRDLELQAADAAAAARDPLVKIAVNKSEHPALTPRRSRRPMAGTPQQTCLRKQRRCCRASRREHRRPHQKGTCRMTR